MLRHILLTTRSLTGLLGVVMLLALFEQSILPDVIVSRDLGWIVAGASRVLGVCGFRGVGGVIEFLVAGVVLVVTHCWLVCDGMPKREATAMPHTWCGRNATIRRFG